MNWVGRISSAALIAALGLAAHDGIVTQSPSAFNYHLQYAAGVVPGYSQIYKFGYNGDLGTAEEDVWSGGGLYTGFATSADTVNLTSSSSADDGDPAGTGAHTVRIEGLGNDWLAASETVTLNGITAATTTTEFYRVFRMLIVSAGTGQRNAGLLTATHTTSGAVLARIEIDQGQTQMAIYAVADGCKLYFDLFSTQVEGVKTADFFLNVRGPLDTSTPSRRIVGRYDGISGSFGTDFDYGGYVEGPADIWISSIATANNTTVSAQGAGVLVCD